jgi:hypothetical protein
MSFELFFLCVEKIQIFETKLNFDFEALLNFEFKKENAAFNSKRFLVKFLHVSN